MLEASCSSYEPHPLTQGNFSDLVRGLNLSEKQAELLGSRSKGCNLFHKDTEMYCIRYSQNEFKEFFSPGNHLLFCNDVFTVMDALGHQHDPTEWRLFTESSKVNLKVVLLHNGNKFQSANLAHGGTEVRGFISRWCH